MKEAILKLSQAVQDFQNSFEESYPGELSAAITVTDDGVVMVITDEKTHVFDVKGEEK